MQGLSRAQNFKILSLIFISEVNFLKCLLHGFTTHCYNESNIPKTIVKKWKLARNCKQCEIHSDLFAWCIQPKSHSAVIFSTNLWESMTIRWWLNRCVSIYQNNHLLSFEYRYRMVVVFTHFASPGLKCCFFRYW